MIRVPSEAQKSLLAGTARNWKAAKRHAAVYAHLRADGLLSAERIVALGTMPVTSLHGTGRGEVHARAERLRDLLSHLPAHRDPRTLVSHILDPDRWVDVDATSAALARQDIDRLRVEAVRMLDEADEELAPDELLRRLRNRIASREPIGLDQDPDVKIVTLWGAKGSTADFTYLVGLCDEALPGRFAEESSAAH